MCAHSDVSHKEKAEHDKDLADKLKVSEVFIYKLAREGKIPFYHIEGALRFSSPEVEEWLQERKNKQRKRGCLVPEQEVENN